MLCAELLQGTGKRRDVHQVSVITSHLGLYCCELSHVVYCLCCICAGTSTVLQTCTSPAEVTLKLRTHYSCTPSCCRCVQCEHAQSAGAAAVPLHLAGSLLLQWSSDKMKPEGPYPAQTCAERKEALYKDIITLFDQGKVSGSAPVEGGLRRYSGTVYNATP